MNERELQVTLTTKQIERLHESLRLANERAQGQQGEVPREDHNLERKLLEYCVTSRRIPHVRNRG